MKFLAINVVVIILLFALYYVFLSDQIFNVTFISVYFPLGIIVFLGSSYVLNGVILKGPNKIWLLVISIIWCLLFIGLTGITTAKYGSILADYYRGYGYSNLLSIPEYRTLKGNYLTIMEALKKEGIPAKHIYEGRVFDDAHVSNRGDYTIVSYMTNNKEYVLFDWISKKIVAYYTQNDMKEMVEKKISDDNIKNIVKISYTDLSINVFYLDGEEKKWISYIVYPTQNGLILGR